MQTGSYTGRDLNSLNCYINRKFKGLCGAVQAGKGPCAGQASPPPGLPQQPRFPQFPSAMGGGDPALQTKVNCFSSSWAWPMHCSSPAASPCSAHTDLGGLLRCNPPEEWKRPVYGWEGRGETGNATLVYLGVAGMWRGRGGASRLPGFLFLYLQPFIFPPPPLFVFHCKGDSQWSFFCWYNMHSPACLSIHSANHLGLSFLREYMGGRDSRW